MFSGFLFAIEKLACSNLRQKVLCFDSSSFFFPSCDLAAGIFFNLLVPSLVQVQKANRKLSASSMKLRFRKKDRSGY